MAVIAIKVGNVLLGTVEKNENAWRPVSQWAAVDYFGLKPTRAEAEHVLLAAYAVSVGPSLLILGDDPYRQLGHRRHWSHGKSIYEALRPTADVLKTHAITISKTAKGWRHCGRL